MRKHVRWFAILILVFSIGIVQAQDEEEGDIQAQLDAFIAEIAPPDGPAVSARITIGDETWTAAGGLVDVTGDTPASPEDRFRIASMSKPFMGVTLMLLQEEGVLSLEDPITQWLPADVISHIANSETATIFHLVTMTSGIPDYLDDDFFAAVAEDPTHAWTADEVITFAYDEPPNFAPGESYEYSNSNFILLQLIVEAATEKPIHEVMRERIFEPLGMLDTYTQIAETLPGEFVHGYEDFDGDGTEEDVTELNDGAGLGDGGLISTTADLTRFYQAYWRDGELLSEESLQAVLESGDNENQYGIGIDVIQGEDYGTIVGHTGGVVGFTGAVYYAVDIDAVVVILYGSNGLDEGHTDALLEIAASHAGDGEEEEE
jgi:D-alanyl-D-alanine carboxypeptidase